MEDGSIEVAQSVVESDLVGDVVWHDGVVLLVQSFDGDEARQDALLVVRGANQMTEAGGVGHPLDQTAPESNKQHTADPTR